MKKKGLLLKLGFLGIGLLSSSAMVVGTFANVTNDPVTKAKAEDKGDFYQISYADGEFKVLLSANPASYKHLNVTALKNVKNALFNAVSAAISEKISWGAPEEDYVNDFEMLTWTPRYYAYQPVTSLDSDFVAKMITASLTTGGVADIDKVDAFNNDPTGAFSETLNYYADRYAAAHPEYSRADVFADIAGCIQDTAQELTNAAYSAQGYAPEEIPTAAGAITEELNHTIQTGITVDLPDVTQMMGIIQNAMDEDTTIEVASFVDNLGQEAVSEEIKNVMVDAEAEEIQDFLIKVRPEVIADVIEAINLGKTEMTSMLDTMGIAKLITVAESIDMEGIKTILQSVPGFTAGDLQEYIKNNATSLSPVEVFNAIKTVKIDGNVVLENKQFVMGGIKAILRDLPKPSEIATWTDDQMKLTWNVTIDTTFGAASVDLTLGFFGNCDYIRTAMDFVARALDISYTNNTLSVHVKSGEYVAKFLRKVINSNAVPQEWKTGMFQFFTNDVQGMYETVNQTLLADLLVELQKIDYESALATILSADFLNSTFRTNKFTDARIDRMVDLFMQVFRQKERLENRFGYEQFIKIIENFKDLTDSQELKIKNLYTKFMNFIDRLGKVAIDSDTLRALIDANDSSVTNQTIYDKIAGLERYQDTYNRVQEMITKIFNKLPASLKTKKPMDFYKGNGQFAYAGTFNFDVHNILTSITSQYGDKLYDAINAVVGQLPSSLSVDLSLEAKDLYSVTYDFGNGETLVGLLPSGVNVPMFAGQDTVGGYDIIKWVDADGNEVTTMPQADTVIYAVTDFEIVESDGVTKEYDGVASTISVDVFPADGNYAYQWYKDGAAVDGANAATLEVVNVLDSGAYTCEVTRIDGYSKTSLEIEVSISVAEIDVSNVAWDYTDAFVCDGNTHEVMIDEATLPEGVTVTYTGTTSATEVGQYTATATLTCDNPNYVLVGETTLNLNWEISHELIDISGVMWTQDDSFEYDGTEKSVGIDLTTLPEHVIIVSIEGNTATAPGQYTATVVLDTDSPAYAIDGDTTLTLDWDITASEIDVSNVAWLEGTTFNYDGTEKSVGIDLTTLPEHVVISSITGNKATIPGQYTATVVLGTDDDGYVLDGETTLTLNWEIKTTRIDVRAVRWTLDPTFEYDGTEKVVNILASTLPAHVTVTNLTGNTATEPGQYTATCTLVPDQYYTLYGPKTLTLSWEIIPGQISVAGVKWTYTQAFTYDQQEHTVNIVDSTLPAHVTVASITGNVATDAGKYTATVTFQLDDARYVIVGGNTKTLAWTIYQAKITLPSITWSADEFTYDGTEHTVTVNAFAGSEGVTITYTGTQSATVVGQYSVTATITAANSNYRILGDNVFTHDWVINSASINLENVAWNYTSAFTYDGEAKSVAIDATTLPEGISVSYEGTTSAINAGSYTAVASLAAQDTNYELIGETTKTLSWTINVAQINVSGVKSNYTSAFTFDGEVKSVDIDAATLPANVSYTVTGTNSALKSGSYNAVFTLAADSENYVLVGNTVITVSWAINKANIDISGIKWNYTDAFVYNGQEKEVKLVDSTIPAHVQTKLGGDLKATNAGKYQAYVTIFAESNDYVLIGNDVLTLNWRINKATIQVLELEWNGQAEYEFDGNEHEVSVKVNLLPEGVGVKYSGTTKASAVGNYVAKATAYLLSDYEANYELVGNLTSTFDWGIVTHAVEDFESDEEQNGDKNGFVKAKNGLEGTLHVVLKDAAELKNLNWDTVFSGSGSVYAYYEAYFTDANGNRIDVGTENEFEIMLLLTEEAQNKKGNYKVVSVTEGEVKEISSSKDGKYMVFNTNLLGNFAIVEVGTNAIPWWVLTLLIVAGAVIAVESYVIIVKAKKKK